MKDTIRFLIVCDYKTRSSLIRGVARRILNAGRSSPLAYAQPSLAAMVSDIVELKLNFPAKIEQAISLTKKSMLMLFLHAHIHRVLAEEAEKQRISGTKLLIDIIQSVDFKLLNVQYKDDLPVEQMVPCSYNLLTECRYKINREIAKRMISLPTGLGKAEFENVGKVINEILACHFQLPLPPPTPIEPVVDSEQVRFTVIMKTDLNNALREYCDKQQVAINTTIVDWINETAEDEVW